MKSLSITARLTITFAALTAVVLAPAAAAFYLSEASAHTAECIDAATDRARSVARALLGQLDEDLLVEFKGQPVSFAVLRTGAEDWALVRASGDLEHAAGVFAAGVDAWTPPPDGLVEAPDGRRLRIAGVPLVRDSGLALEDLPPAVRRVAEETHPEALYLNARRKATKGGNIVEVRKLNPDHITEIKTSESGEVLKVTLDALPCELERSFLAGIPEETRPSRDVRISWRACSGQLIAVVDGTAAGGAPARIAMNRLGERFFLDENGDVTGLDPDSRLVVLAAVDAAPEISRKRTLLLGLGLGVPFVWLGLAVIGWFVARRAMSPVGGIVEAARRVHLSDFGGRVPVGAADDELARIATTINDMLDRLETGYRRERKFTGDASHELRGPLTKIQADAELALSQDRSSEAYRAALLRIAGYARGMTQLVQSLLLLARLESDREKLEKEPFDLTQLIVETVGSLPEEEIRRIRLEVGEAASPIEAVGQRSLVGTALHNLIENALRYSPRDAPVDVRVRPNGSRVFVEVEDRGGGFAPENRERAFDRFFRVDAARTREAGGCGLGLSIVRAIASAHGTSVELRSSSARGTVAVFELVAAR